MKREDSRQTAGIIETLKMEIEVLLRVIKIGTLIRVITSLITGIMAVIHAVETEMEDRQIDSRIADRAHSLMHQFLQVSHQRTEELTRTIKTKDLKRMLSTKKKS